jgi:hypothetical protein
MDTISKLFQKTGRKGEQELIQNLFKCKINVGDSCTKLQAFKRININGDDNDWELICEKNENYCILLSMNMKNTS